MTEPTVKIGDEIYLTHAQAPHEKGSQHVVINVVPHGGYTDEPYQVEIEGQIFVTPNHFELVPDEAQCWYCHPFCGCGWCGECNGARTPSCPYDHSRSQWAAYGAALAGGRP